MRKIINTLALIQLLLLCAGAANAQSKKELWAVDVTVKYQESLVCDTTFTGVYTGYNKHVGSTSGTLTANIVADCKFGQDSIFSIMWVPGGSQVVRSTASGSFTETNVNNMQLKMNGTIMEGEDRTDTWQSTEVFRLNSLNIYIKGREVIADVNAVAAAEYVVKGKWYGTNPQTNKAGWNAYEELVTPDTVNVGGGGSSETNTARVSKVKGGWIVTCNSSEPINEPGNNYRLGPTVGTRTTEITFWIKKLPNNSVSK